MKLLDVRGPESAKPDFGASQREGGLVSFRILRQPLFWLALALLAIKAFQFTLDHRPLLFSDSAAFLLNALKLRFLPERSYVYGGIIRALSVPFHSLVPMVAFQALAGAIVDWLLAFALIRFLRVRWWIAVLAALALAWDPTQVIHERLVMTEASAGLVAAIFLVTALQYLSAPRHVWLLALALLGGVLVGLRVVYVPMVFAFALLIPLAALPRFAGSPRRFAIALGLSIAAVITCQAGYQRLTGWLAGREPAYYYKTGFFLAGNLAPMLEEQDAPDPLIAAAMREQQRSAHPLSSTFTDNRNFQIWDSNGLMSRIRNAYGGDKFRASRQAETLALHAVRRNPTGFLWLGIRCWLDYPVLLSKNMFPWVLRIEDGADPAVQPTDEELRMLAPHFPVDRAIEPTLSRRYHRRFGRLCCWMQYLSPFLGLTAIFLAPNGARRAAAFLALWSALLLAVTCLTTPTTLRYLHPLSFPGLAAVAVLLEGLLRLFIRPALAPGR